MKKTLEADSLEQQMLERICQDLKWSQLNSHVPRNAENQLSFAWRFFLLHANIADVDWINLLRLMYTFINENEISSKCGPTKLSDEILKKQYLKLKLSSLAKRQKVKCKQLESLA